MPSPSDRQAHQLAGRQRERRAERERHQPVRSRGTTRRTGAARSRTSPDGWRRRRSSQPTDTRGTRARAGASRTLRTEVTAAEPEDRKGPERRSPRSARARARAATARPPRAERAARVADRRGCRAERAARRTQPSVISSSATLSVVLQTACTMFPRSNRPILKFRYAPRTIAKSTTVQASIEPQTASVHTCSPAQTRSRATEPTRESRAAPAAVLSLPPFERPEHPAGRRPSSSQRSARGADEAHRPPRDRTARGTRAGPMCRRRPSPPTRLGRRTGRCMRDAGPTGASPQPIRETDGRVVGNDARRHPVTRRGAPATYRSGTRSESPPSAPGHGQATTVTASDRVRTSTAPRTRPVADRRASPSAVAANRNGSTPAT